MAQLNQKLTSGSDVVLPVVDQLALYFTETKNVAFKDSDGDFVPTLNALANSSSFAATASVALDVDYVNVTNKPTLVSASSQVSYDGLSNIPADIVSSSTQVTTLLPNGTVSSSGQVSYTGLSNIPVGILSSSTQINALSNVSASFATSASRAQTSSVALNVEYNNVNNKPTLVSASSQVSYTGLSNIPVGIVSSSTQVTTLLPNGTVSSSGQVSYTGLSNVPVGIVSASSQVNYTGLSNIPAGILSSSTQINTLANVSASFATSASRAQTSSLALNVDYANVNNKPTLVSASSQVSYTGLSNIPAGILSSSTQINTLSNVSASFATSASRAQTSSVALNVEYNNVNNKPTLVSASSQVSYTGLSNIPAGIVSSSTQVTTLLPNGTVSSSGQVSYTGLSNVPVGIVSASSQVSYAGLSNIPAGILSSSTQINALSNVSASFATSASRAQTSSVALNVEYNNVNNKPTLVSASSQIDVRNTTGITTIATTGSNTFTGVQTIGNTTNATDWNTGALVVDGGVGIEKDVWISGSLNVIGLLTAISTSIQYVTASQVDIGNNIINLNTDTPALRYGGISVVDSGSVGVSASLLYDSLTNNWVFKHKDVGDSTEDFSNVLFGPRGTNPDNIPVLTGNYLVKVENDGHGHHLTTSSIVDNGTTVTVETQLSVVGAVSASVFSGSGAQLTGVTATNVDYANVSNKPTLVSASSQVSYTGLSNIPVGIVSSSTQVTTLLPNGTVSSSSQVSYTGLSNVPAGIVSASSQVSYTGLSNVPSGILSSSTQINTLSNVSASFATSASRAQTASLALAVDYANVNNKPTLVSASSQVSYTGLSNIPAGIVSSSTQVTTLLPNGTVSSSSQVSYTGLSNIPTGILSSSTQINNLSNVSASFATSALTASFLLGGIESASFATSASRAQTSSFSLNVDYANVINQPTLVSASSQVSYTGLSNIPSGIVSSSTQVTSLLPTGTVSSSTQVDYTQIQNKPTTIATASYVEYSNVANTPPGLVSSSAQALDWTVASASVATSASFATNALSASWAPGGGGTPVDIQDEGLLVLSAPSAINFVGLGVTVTAVGSVANVSIPGGAGTELTGSVTGSFTGVASGSFFGNGFGLTNLPGGTDEKSPTLTYSGSLLTQITYESGNYKLFTYSGGLLTQSVFYQGTNTITKTFLYNLDGTLASILQT